MVQLNPAGVRLEPGCEAMAEQFRSEHMLVLPGFLDEQFVRLLERTAAASTFVRETVPDLGQREIESPLRSTAAILLALRNRQLLNWFAAVTGSADTLAVGGNIARSWPGGIDRLDWHDDMGITQRVAGLTIRLGSQSFEGGTFELREKRRPDSIRQHHHAQVGDALLFAVSPRLEHRVLPIAAGGPRCMFAGWIMTTV